MEALFANASIAFTASMLLAYLLTLAWEHLRPLLPADNSEGSVRWAGNFGLLIVNHAVPYAVTPVAMAFAAWWADSLGLGLLHALDTPLWLALPLTLLVLDLKGWLLHWLMHRVPALWRMHQVHHSDLRFDAALAFRFHPGEAALVALGASACVVVLGLPIEAVVISGLVGSVHNVFVHANARLGPRSEAAMRWLFVTPDLHRVHHSLSVEDSMHNYGIVFPWWDRLFGTWRTPVDGGPRVFGLDGERDAAQMSLGRLLLMPFGRPRG